MSKVRMPDGYTLRTGIDKGALYYGVKGIAMLIEPDANGGFSVIPYDPEVRDMGTLTNENYLTPEEAFLAVALRHKEKDDLALDVDVVRQVLVGEVVGEAECHGTAGFQGFHESLPQGVVGLHVVLQRFLAELPHVDHPFHSRYLGRDVRFLASDIEPHDKWGYFLAFDDHFVLPCS